MEIWREVDGVKVSNYGRVMGDRGEVLSESVDKNGYVVIRLSGRTIKPHRLVAAAFVPNPDNKPEVNHIDGCKTNNASSNLEYVTHAENMAHASKIGLMRNVGKRSVITEEQAEEIRQSKATQAELARKFGVSQATISRVKNGLTKNIRFSA